MNAQFAVSSAQTISFAFQIAIAICSATFQQISGTGTSKPLIPLNALVQMRILVDRDSIEIFANNVHI